MNACTQTPGYYHRTDRSAMNCCQLLRALQISDNTNKFNDNGMKRDGMQMSGSPLNNQTDLNQMAAEIQCKDISQSQMSPVVQQQSVQKQSQTRQMQQQPPQQQQQYQQQQQQQQPLTNLYATQIPMQMSTNTLPNSAIPVTTVTVAATQNIQQNQQQTSMRPDIYQRTLDYVQSCQSWADQQPETVTSTSNMQISDMSTSLSSLLEENRYYNNSVL